MNERIRTFRELIKRDIQSSQLRRALARIKAFAREQALDNIYRKAEAVESRYYYMLRSMTQGSPDPDQALNTAGMLDEASVIAEEAYRLSSMKDSDTLLSSFARYAFIRRDSESIPTLAVDFLTEQASILSDPDALLDSGRRAPLERLSRDIFHRIWADFPLDSDSKEAILNLVSDRDIPLADRVSWISALTLGSLESFDPARLELLLEIARTSTATVLRAAAFSGLFFALYRYSRRSETPFFRKLWNSILEIPDAADDMRTVIYEYTRQMGTLALSTRIENEILPKLNRIGSDMMRRLSGIDLSGKSPEELQDLLSGLDLPGMSDEITRHAMQNVSEMAEAGDDVFFAFLKPMHQQAFFTDIANWWLGFDVTRSEFAEIFDGEGAVLGEMFGRLEFLCDSDKYAVLMAVADAPRTMRARTLGMMVEQYSMIEEHMPKEESDEAEQFRRAVATYMKNAYRFFSLFRRKGEMKNPFAPETGINSSPLLMELYTDYEISRRIAERLYASVKPFAFPFYAALLRATPEPSVSMLLAAADSAEAANYTDYAVDWYLRALDVDSSDEKTLMKVVDIMRKKGMDAQLLKILDRTGLDSISGPALLESYALALISAERFDDAMRVLDKINYIGAENPAVNNLRRAEVALANGNPFEVLDILEAVAPATEGEKFMLNQLKGYALMVSHEPDHAFAAFCGNLGAAPDLSKFPPIESDFEKRKKMLRDVYRLSDEEIVGMLDALRYSLEA